MNWKKVPPYFEKNTKYYPPRQTIAPMDMMIAVGFGYANVTRDGKIIFEERQDEEKYHELSEFEEMAQKDPDHDWRVLLDAPLRSQEYQRHGKNKWVLIARGSGWEEN